MKNAYFIVAKCDRNGHFDKLVCLCFIIVGLLLYDTHSYFIFMTQTRVERKKEKKPNEKSIVRATMCDVMGLMQ